MTTTKKLNKKSNIWKYILSLFIILVHISPFYILIGMAFKSPRDVSSRWILPGYLYLDNIQMAIEKGRLLRAMFNSLIITLFAVVFVTVIGAMAAYPLARNKTKFNKGILLFVLGVMMVPPLSILVPLYSMMTKINGVSTYWGIIVILVTFSLPMSIFLYTNFITTIPTALDEAATIDGCNKLTVFFRIILPLIKPVTATVIILTGIGFWNDYQFSLYILQSSDMRTVTLAISTFFSQNSNNLNAASAGALIAIFPVIILYLSLQKYFVKGMVDSAVK